MLLLMLEEYLFLLQGLYLLVYLQLLPCYVNYFHLRTRVCYISHYFSGSCFKFCCLQKCFAFINHMGFTTGFFKIPKPYCFGIVVITNMLR